MTVKELIEELKKYDGELEVISHGHYIGDKYDIVGTQTNGFEVWIDIDNEC